MAKARGFTGAVDNKIFDGRVNLIDIS